MTGAKCPRGERARDSERPREAESQPGSITRPGIASTGGLSKQAPFFVGGSYGGARTRTRLPKARARCDTASEILAGQIRSNRDSQMSVFGGDCQG